eukprot:TRINITY_DN1230_c0_g1_i1.p1 TRINITY_DN1230_c0_g1~~TRINITY_DN1230_c0_g1_i1.p1  ORF type:complete len:141 (-),score=15.88 TRINITY_DN1230_c0_g1_i1:64-429(-)
MEPEDPFRQEMTQQLLIKLYTMGVTRTKKSLAETAKITASSFCRRRLAVIVVRLHMAQSLKEAVTYIEQGQIRVGPHVVTDPAFHVTRTYEDFVTWVDSGKLKEKVMRYNDRLDDFVLLGN